MVTGQFASICMVLRYFVSFTNACDCRGLQRIMVAAKTLSKHDILAFKSKMLVLLSMGGSTKRVPW